MKGGKRKGAGRKSAPYQTKTIAFRVRSEWVDEIKTIVKNKLIELKNNNGKDISKSKTYSSAFRVS
jgi:hypothetical protein